MELTLYKMVTILIFDEVLALGAPCIRFRDFNEWRLCWRLYQVTELTAVVTKCLRDAMKFTELGG